MGSASETQAVTLTQPRDRLQTRFVEALARPAGSGQAAEKVAGLVAIIGKADLIEAQRLSKRLKSDTDRLGRYFRSRFGPVGQGRVTGSLADRILAQHGAEPEPGLRISYPGSREFDLRPSSAAEPLISALRMLVPAGSTERFRTIHRLFRQIDPFSAVRLLERLRQPDDSLRALLFRRLSSAGATYLIDRVLAPSVQGLDVKSLPESMTSEQLRHLLDHGRIIEVESGKVLRRETHELRDELFTESVRRGDAFTPASTERLEDIALQARFPRLGPKAIREIMQKATEHQGKLVSGAWLGNEKRAFSGFLTALSHLRGIAQKEKEPFFIVLGTWVQLMSVNYKRGTFLDVWVREMDSLGFALERAYKTNLNALGYTWIHAVHTPGFLEFVGELWDEGELFKLKNFTAAAKGGWDALVLTGKGIISLADPDTYKQLRRDWEEHGADFFKLLNAETLKLFKAQLSRDIKTFQRLPEDKQARFLSTMMTMAVIDRKFPKIASGTVKVAGKGKSFIKSKLDGPDPSKSPMARTVRYTPSSTEILEAGITNSKKAGLPSLIGKLKKGARETYNKIGINKPRSQGIDHLSDTHHSDEFYRSHREVVDRLVEEVKIKRANKGIEVDDIRGNNAAAASVLVIDDAGRVERRVYTETNGPDGHSEEWITARAKELRDANKKKVIYIEAVFTERSACKVCVSALTGFNRIDGEIRNPALFFIAEYNGRDAFGHGPKYGSKHNAEEVRKLWLGN